MTHRRAWTLLAAALCAGRWAEAAEPPASAPPAQLAVRVAESAKGCPDATTLAARVNEITGWRALVSEPSASARLHFTVEVSANEAGHSAIIRATGSRSGERHIADIGTDCAGLSDALAVTLAIIVDDERVAPADGVPTPRLMREGPPAPPPAVTAHKSVTTTWRPYAALGATLGVLESIAFGPALGLAFERERLVIGAEGWWLPAQSFQLDPGEAEVSLLAASLYGCWKTVAADQPSWLALCAHVSGGRLSGSGSGFSRNRSAHRPWVAPGVGAVGATPIVGSLELVGAAKLMVPVHREAFIVDNLGTAHETPPLGLMLTIGLSLSIR